MWPSPVRSLRLGYRTRGSGPPQRPPPPREARMPIKQKPSRNEDEYFRKLDAELIKAQRAKLDAGELDLLRQTERHGIGRVFDLLGRKAR